MKTAKDLTNELIGRARAMQLFEVVQPVPDNFELCGVMPFNIKIDRDDFLTCYVHAVTLEEAESQVGQWLQECTGD
jgi:hypothetical protein